MQAQHYFPPLKLYWFRGRKWAPVKLSAEMQFYVVRDLHKVYFTLKKVRFQRNRWLLTCKTQLGWNRGDTRYQK